ncbi:MAG: hypothetical protein OEN55_07470 [Alphaproteobacteria bacterium]|nr:hypothetical protein [Alphaproteobacteria bacterium]
MAVTAVASLKIPEPVGSHGGEEMGCLPRESGVRAGGFPAELTIDDA